MKFAFIIQGEGRGHQTQAIALAEILIKNGHEISVVLVGSVVKNKIPTLLCADFPFKTIPFLSPSLHYNPKTNGLSIKKTVLNALPNLKSYLNSIRTIKTQIEKENVDIIINFYDFLGGIHNCFFAQNKTVYCIAHQYLLLNKNFVHPKGYWWDKMMVNLNSRITALGAEKLLALSFSKFEQDKNIIPVPPLIRSKIKDLKVVSKDFILVYLTQNQLLKEIIKAAEKVPNVKFECFAENFVCEYLPPNIIIHPISNQIFLDKMAECRAIITTAGFESVCEAAFIISFNS